MLDKWDERFMDLARLVGSWSKDKSRGVGAVIVDSNKRIVSVGYNGFPQGANDNVKERHERPAKYLYTEHAERNALYSALRSGANVQGCTMYCTLFPCADCARAIIQSGISEIVTYRPDKDDRYAESHKVALEMLYECNVIVKFLN